MNQFEIDKRRDQVNEKIKQAFKLLRKQRIKARINIVIDFHDFYANIPVDKFDGACCTEKDRTPPWLNRGNHNILIDFMGFNDNKIGEQICTALSTADLKFKWNGSENHCIEVLI